MLLIFGISWGEFPEIISLPQALNRPNASA